MAVLPSETVGDNFTFHKLPYATGIAEHEAVRLQVLRLQVYESLSWLPALSRFPSHID